MTEDEGHGNEIDDRTDIQRWHEANGDNGGTGNITDNDEGGTKQGGGSKEIEPDANSPEKKLESIYIKARAQIGRDNEPAYVLLSNLRSKLRRAGSLGSLSLNDAIPKQMEEIASELEGALECRTIVDNDIIALVAFLGHVVFASKIDAKGKLRQVDANSVLRRGNSLSYEPLPPPRTPPLPPLKQLIDLDSLDKLDKEMRGAIGDQGKQRNKENGSKRPPCTSHCSQQLQARRPDKGHRQKNVRVGDGGNHRLLATYDPKTAGDAEKRRHRQRLLHWVSDGDDGGPH